MRAAPCKDCKKKYIGCHGKCLDYIDWQQEKSAINDRIRKQRMVVRVADSVKIDGCRKARRA